MTYRQASVVHYLERKMNYLEAWAVAKQTQGFVPYDRLDLERTKYPVWARGWVAHPELKKTFRKEDIVDARNRSTLPWSDVSRLAGDTILEENIALFVIPKEIESKRRGLLIIPESIVVVRNFAQPEESAYTDVTGCFSPIFGSPDKETHLPIEDECGIFGMTRYNGIGVRPIVREFGGRVLYDHLSLTYDPPKELSMAVMTI